MQIKEVSLLLLYPKL